MIGEEVCVVLWEVSYVVDWVCDGNVVYVVLDQQDYDVVLLDLGLFGVDGLQVLCQLCWYVIMLVLILIVCDGVQDCIDGFDSGVDDYIFKFFVMGELLVWLCVVMWCKLGVVMVVLDNGELFLDLVDKIVCW